jgi:hypothetical protein
LHDNSHFFLSEFIESNQTADIFLELRGDNEGDIE